MYLVVLTGGIGSGKSTVAQLFAELGAIYFDADAVVRELLLEDTVQNKLTRRWGAEIIAGSAHAMRQRLKDKLLNSESDRKWLEGLLHPMVLQKLSAMQHSLDVGYLVAEIPLYFQMTSPPPANAVLMVSCPVDVRIKRLKVRRFTDLTEWQINQFIALQSAQEVDKAKVDDVINNDSSITKLKEQVERLHHKYLAMAAASGCAA